MAENEPIVTHDCDCNEGYGPDPECPLCGGSGTQKEA